MVSVRAQSYKSISTSIHVAQRICLVNLTLTQESGKWIWEISLSFPHWSLRLSSWSTALWFFCTLFPYSEHSPKYPSWGGGGSTFHCGKVGSSSPSLYSAHMNLFVLPKVSGLGLGMMHVESLVRNATGSVSSSNLLSARCLSVQLQDPEPLFSNVSVWVLDLTLAEHSGMTLTCLSLFFFPALPYIHLFPSSHCVGYVWW